MDRLRQILTLSVIGLLLFGLGGALLFLPDRTVSVSERRRLKQRPALTAESVLDGTFMTAADEYLLDQFPARDLFRAGNAVLRLDVLRQLEVNGLYRIGDGLYKRESEYRPEQVSFAAAKMNEIRGLYLDGSRVFYAMIPDKNYFVAEAHGYPHLPYDDMCALVQNRVRGMEYIDLWPILSLADYYKTDTHWRQERLLPVAERLAEAMGVALPPDAGETAAHVLAPFYGVYHGQLALALPGEPLTYLTNGYTDGASVHSAEQGALPVYDPAKFDGVDGYDVFLSGAQAVVTLTCDGPPGRELILFRDSYGSSLAPLLLGAYSKITLIDLRYIKSDLLADYVQFDGQDVLFLYSTSLFNTGMLLK